MPSASDEQRALMQEWFGDPISEAGPEKFLRDAGYTLRQDWHWDPKPGIQTYKQMDRKEFDCLLFLVHEWDYGGLIVGGQAPKE